MNTSYTHDLERLVVAQVIFTLPIAPLETSYFVLPFFAFRYAATLKRSVLPLLTL